MALYSRKEFCKICDIKSNQLSVHIKRHEVVLSTDPNYPDHIDGNNEWTRLFVAKRIASKKSAKQKAEQLVYKIASKYKMKLTDMNALAKDLEDCINEAADDVLKHKEHLRFKLCYVG